jgi:Transposase DDE domain
MNHGAMDEDGWRSLVKRLPGGKALRASARASGALVRRRGVKTPAALLRLILAYGPGGQSLRETSAWAAMAGVAQVSDVALLKRLQRAAPWLEGLVGGLLAQRVALTAAGLPPGRWLRLMDGTQVAAPGDASAAWRLHVTYELSQQRLSHVALTDRRGAEKLERAPVEPGEIRVADRCYARPQGLRYMCDGGGDFIARLGVRALKLHHPDGRAFSLTAFLKKAANAGAADAPVLIGHSRQGKAWKPFAARVIAIPKPPAAAAHSRQAARRASQRQGSRPTRQTLTAAKYLLLVTSLDPHHYPAAQVAALYRLRWQIELAIKRLKSLLHIDRLPAKDPDLARCWLYAHLLLAILIEDMNQEFLDSFPSGP